MVLVHDDDFARLNEIGDITVGRTYIHTQHAVVLMLFCFQRLDSLQSSILLDYIRSLRPTHYKAFIGELFQCSNFPLLTGEGFPPERSIARSQQYQR